MPPPANPVAISDLRLDRVFSQGVAEREIRAAVTAGDLDLAQSFLDLAGRPRCRKFDPALIASVKDAQTKAATASHTAGRFVQGLCETGEPTDIASLAGTAVGDLFVFGDIRDAAREGKRYLLGEPANSWIIGLAGVGIAITAGTYALARSWRAGTDRLDAGQGGAPHRPDRSGPARYSVAREAGKVEKAGGLTELVSDVGRIESKAGTQAALDSLQIAQEPRDVSLWRGSRPPRAARPALSSSSSAAAPYC